MWIHLPRGLLLLYAHVSYIISYSLTDDVLFMVHNVGHVYDFVFIFMNRKMKLFHKKKPIKVLLQSRKQQTNCLLD